MPLNLLEDPQASLTVGDKLFTNFTYAATGTMPPSSAVNIIPIQDGDGHFGIRIQGGFLDLPGGGASDALVTFTVTALNPDKPIIGVNLAANLAIVGPGLAAVTETFLPDLPSLNLLVFDSPGGIMLVDQVTFDTAYESLPVQKDILLYASDTGTGFATVSFVDQIFVQIPEPASLGFAALACLWLARRSRTRPVS